MSRKYFISQKNLDFLKFQKECSSRIVKQIFTRFCFDQFGGCGSPNRAYNGFLESPICLVYCPKLSANESLYFGSYRSRSEVCSQEIRTRVTNFVILFEGFRSSNKVNIFPRIP